jgi:AcrR family transcriptional regulator
MMEFVGETSDANSSMRRVPQQARSREHVQAMIDAAEHLIGANGYDALTTTQVAQEAGVTVATLYQFFPDKRALAQVLARRYVDMYITDVESHGRPDGDGSWWDDLEQNWAAIARMNREIPAFARMQFGDSIDVHLLDDELTNSEVVIDRLSSTHDGAHALDDPEIRRVMTIIVTAMGPLFGLAFRDRPEGDPQVLAEIGTLIRGYLREKFADRTPSPVDGRSPA